MYRYVKLLSLGLLLLVPAPAKALNDTLDIQKPDRKRLCYTLAASATVLTGSTILLNEAWYKNYPRSSFHFYNDWEEWLQMDKTGHIVASYNISLAGIELMKQTGMSNRRAAWLGGLYGPVFLSTIEILDGFSEKWGFSIPDMAANIAGSAVAVVQELLFERQPARFKYSYHESGLAHYRPDALGRNLPERMLKDYNGQTHWLSVNINSLTGNSALFPEWLNVAAGYSAYGMLGGYKNPAEANGIELPGYERARQLFLAPDIDLSKIDTGSQFLNYILRPLAILKFPAPAIEYNQVEGFKFHLIYF